MEMDLSVKDASCCLHSHISVAVVASWSQRSDISPLYKKITLNNSIPHLGILTVAVPASALVSEYKINDLEQHDCLHLLKIHTSSPEQLSFAPMYTVHIHTLLSVL